MAAPHEIAAAKRAPDRMARTRRMAEVMREREAFGGACTIAQLGQDGFTGGEVFAYIDDARAILSDRPGAGEIRISPARAEAMQLVAKAETIRARQGAAVDAPSAAIAADTPAPVQHAPPIDAVRRVLTERFGRLGPAILDDLGSAGFSLASADEVARRERRERELECALEDALPLIDLAVGVLSLRTPMPGWSEFRSTVAELVAGDAR